jgi:predicted negative regulator of RcsB-dependent stress response
MPIYKKLPRSKPKKPDEFISFFDHLYHETYKRGPAVLAVISVLLLVGIGVLFWRSFHERRASQISESVFDVSKKGKEEQEKTLHEIKKANLYAPLGTWASLELANRADGEGACQTILKELEPYIGHGPIDSMRGLIFQKVGACYEQEKNFKAAEELYEKAASDSKNPLRDWSSFRLAMVKKEEGDLSGAEKLLKEMVEVDSKAGLPVKEEARIALLLASEPSPESATKPESAPESKKSK